MRHKKDLLNNTLESNEKYHNWINLHKDKILPKLDKNTEYQSDINNDPQKYIKYMIYMNIELEKIGTKQFQFFPLITEIVPKYCTFDTKTLIELFIVQNKKKYLDDISSYKDEIWKMFSATARFCRPLKRALLLFGA